MKPVSGKILSTTSLLILLGFIGFWLYSSYLDEIETVKKELQLVFSTSGKEVKDSLFNEMLLFADNNFTDESENHDSTSVIVRVKRPSLMMKKIIVDDSLKKKQDFFTKNEFRVFIAGEGELNQDGEWTHDSGNVDITVHHDSMPKFDVISLTTVDERELGIVEENFSKKIKEANLPCEYMILETFDSTLLNEGLSIVINKINPVHGQTSIAKFSQYKGYILWRIWPQIAFGIFLFSVVSIAFFISNKRVDELERISDMKNDFVSNMTHELKTPISTVSVAIEALKSFDVLKDKGKTREYLDISKNELNRLTLLVDKVLKMSQFDNNFGQLEKRIELDFREVIESVSSSMKLQLEKYNASLFVDLEEGEYPVLGDRIHLANIVYNLLDNALKYGGKKPKIWIHLEQGIDNVILKVKDSGLGISKENQAKIFDKFFRVPTGNTHNIKGHGLGLSYVAGVVKAHDGNISVSSSENQGSEFVINLPKYE